jgi:1-acyl-sn-glycerol-3-phosphate acyltransferase
MKETKRRKPLPIRLLHGLHSIFLIGWVVSITALMSTLVILFRPFHVGISRWVGRAWAFLLLAAAGIRLRIRGAKKLDKSRNYIFMSNHLSAADIIILYTAIPFAVGYLAKKELFRIPLLGWAMRCAGHIPVDRGNPREARKSIDEAIEVIRRGELSLIIFPEGTRSITGEMKSFKLGGFSLAISSGVDIVPVAVAGTRELLPKGALHINPRPIAVNIGEPIESRTLKKTEKSLLAKATREAIEALRSEIDAES